MSYLDLVTNKIQVYKNPKKKGLDKIIFLVFSYHKNYSKCNAIMDTWGKEVNIIFFVDKKTNNMNFPYVIIDVPGGESYSNMWRKIIEIWRYVNKNLINSYEFFFICGDDTFVIPNNALKYINTLDNTKPIYCGRILKPLKTQWNVDFEFNSGGSGYILNKISIKYLLKNLYKPEEETSCEDVHVALSLRNLVRPFDTRDHDFSEIFHNLHPSYAFKENYGFEPVSDKIGSRNWFTIYTRDVNPKLYGLDIISEFTCSFHYIDKDTMLLLYNKINNKS